MQPIFAGPDQYKANAERLQPIAAHAHANGLSTLVPLGDYRFCALWHNDLNLCVDCFLPNLVDNLIIASTIANVQWRLIAISAQQIEQWHSFNIGQCQRNFGNVWPIQLSDSGSQWTQPSLHRAFATMWSPGWPTIS